jgi:2-methylcitrate dehydratase PrpD
MQNAADHTAIQRLVANILETRFENISAGDLTHAKNRVIDTIGCAIGGAHDPGNPEMVKLVKDWGGKEEATILVHGGKAPGQNAAMLNSTFARSFDFGTVSCAYGERTVPSHLSETTVMTALSMGEAKKINGKEFLCALLVGDDLGTRVLHAGAGSGLGPDWDRIGPINPLAAAAIAGRILGLNHKQMKNALGIALNTLAGSFDIIHDTTTSFKIGNSLGARNGIFAAELAGAGWTGPEDALLGNSGFYRLYVDGCAHPEVLTDSLGQKYYSDRVFKPYCCCRATHAAVDSALALVNKYKIDAGDIKEAIVFLPQSAEGNVLGLPFKMGDFPHADGIFSNHYVVAIALLKKGVRPEHFSLETMRSPQVNALLKKIKLSTVLPSGESAAVKVILKDGREYSEATEVARGDQLKNPVSREDIIAKFWVNVDFSKTVSREKAEKVLSMVDQLEELDNVSKIVELLAV